MLLKQNILCSCPFIVNMFLRMLRPCVMCVIKRELVVSFSVVCSVCTVRIVCLLHVRYSSWYY